MGPELRMTQKSLSTTKNLGMDDGGKQELRLGCREVKPAMDLLDHWRPLTSSLGVVSWAMRAVD